MRRALDIPVHRSSLYFRHQRNPVRPSAAQRHEDEEKDEEKEEAASRTWSRHALFEFGVTLLLRQVHPAAAVDSGP